DLEYLWTGSTRFKILPETPVAAFSSTSTTAADNLAEMEVLDPVAFPCYGGDTFPSHWSEEQRATTARHYKAIPEEFYTKSGRRPITPDNMDAWLAAVKRRRLRLHAWEWFSGSGRLSLCLLMANMIVGPPIDYRYGWDVAHAPHQALLQRCHEVLAPAHLFASPSWSSWMTATNKDPELRELDRRPELPAIQYLTETCLIQRQMDCGFTVEQPAGSSLLKESPLRRLCDHSGIKTVRFDQCMFGAQDEAQLPLRKATCLLTNRRWHKVIKRCGGHRGKSHGQVQGRLRGCSRTAMAMVFPKRLCQELSMFSTPVRDVNSVVLLLLEVNILWFRVNVAMVNHLCEQLEPRPLAPQAHRVHRILGLEHLHRALLVSLAVLRQHHRLWHVTTWRTSP
ncbi:unnamed protein product, partial [Symbiodinium necroappetens]